ncbi:hypothetical protein [Thioalkalivibrio sp. HL-Eb18]|uniref:hypothetical protein n=1 Tax=Thioalkalivibrio sp. HL-Eb18 TaxID=1266913 RepID=UPI0012DE3A4A|nr:hypothetical protein [Thioalkalivibrio sp. HL-Eb18]
MNIKQNPFSFYDFLGYIIPGAVFLYGAILVAGHLSEYDTPIGFALTVLSFENPEVYIPFVLLAYITGHFLSFLSSITVERYSIWAHGYPSKYLLGISSKGYFYLENHKKLRQTMRVLVFVLLAPISVLDWLLGTKAGMRDLYAKALDPLLIELLRKRIALLIGDHAQVNNQSEHGSANDNDFFRYAYHYAVENAENHLPKMQNYVALYGFLRTLTLISLTIFWISTWHALTAQGSLLAGITAVSLSATTTFLLFMGFVKFYRRFSLEALMAMAVTYPSKDLD